MNEKFAPELLDSKTELVECMLEQLKEMEENIKRAKKGDFKVSIHRLEVRSIVLTFKGKKKQNICGTIQCKLASNSRPGIVKTEKLW